MNPNSLSLTITLVVGSPLYSTARSQCSTFWSSAAPQAELSGVGRCSTLWDPDGAGPLPQRLVVGGDTLIGGSAAGSQRVMTWDGSQWQALGNGPGTMGTTTVVTTWNGLLVAAGSFRGGGTDRIALWDGSAWQPLGPGLGSPPVAITEWNGNLVAVLNATVPVVLVWNGAAWTALPRPPTATFARAAVQFQGLLCVGRDSSGSSGAIERWNGTTWLPTIPANGPIRALGVRAFQLNSSLYVGGGFTAIGPGGTPANRVASTAGGTAFAWVAVGTGLSGTNCLTLHVRATSAVGAAVVAHTDSSTVPMMQLSGSSFVGMGNAFPHSLSFYGGSYHGTSDLPGVAACQRYDGTNWVPVRGHSIDGGVRALTLSGSDAIVGGTIQSTSGALLNRIARWNGTTFQPLGTGVAGASVDALSRLSNGDLVAGGVFAMAGGNFASNIARWNGTAWSPLGTGCDEQVLALCRMPNGDVVAGRGFHPPTANPDSGISRWNGSGWSGFGSGLAAVTPSASVAVRAIAHRADGALIVGGDFGIADGLVARGLATLSPTCPASASPYGAGCSSAAGPLMIAAQTLPFVGATLRTTTTGVASGSLCLGVIGFTQLSIPLSALLAQGQPGCSLLASLDILLLLTNAAGNTATSQLALPNDRSLIGVQFFQQTIPLEFNGAGSLVAARGSNGLAATIGTL